jgi:hypothetical protein
MTSLSVGIARETITHLPGEQVRRSTFFSASSHLYDSLRLAIDYDWLRLTLTAVRADEERPLHAAQLRRSQRVIGEAKSYRVPQFERAYSNNLLLTLDK